MMNKLRMFSHSLKAKKTSVISLGDGSIYDITSAQADED